MPCRNWDWVPVLSKAKSLLGLLSKLVMSERRVALATRNASLGFCCHFFDYSFLNASRTWRRKADVVSHISRAADGT